MQGLVHCGICPTSVLIRGDKSVCLCDLFHAFDVHTDSNCKLRHRGGCLDYMPPEMILSSDMAVEDADVGTMHEHHNQITPAVDVWQVGF
jgi:serine/threonine protein kinase